MNNRKVGKAIKQKIIITSVEERRDGSKKKRRGKKRGSSPKRWDRVKSKARKLYIQLLRENQLKKRHSISLYVELDVNITVSILSHQLKGKRYFHNFIRYRHRKHKTYT